MCTASSTARSTWASTTACLISSPAASSTRKARTWPRRSALPEAYPAEALKNAAIRALRRKPELMVSSVQMQGEPSLRAVLARRALESGMQLTADDIVITHGCIEALNIALRAVTQPGDTVAVESPTYYGLLQILQSLNLRALEIPTSPAHRISIEALELALQTHGGIRAAVVMPNLHNPLGAVMPDAHKARLAALCAEHDIALIEDDTYGALTDGDAPLKAVKSFDTTGHVIHCVSLRKTLAPGLRPGLGGRRALAGPHPDAEVRAEPVERSAGPDHGRRLHGHQCLRPPPVALSPPVETAARADGRGHCRVLPAGTRLTVPAGSMLLWVELPGKRSANAVFDAALAHGIRFVPGHLFSNSDRYASFMRVSCGFPLSSETDQGLRRLGAIAGEGL